MTRMTPEWRAEIAEARSRAMETQKVSVDAVWIYAVGDLLSHIDAVEEENTALRKGLLNIRAGNLSRFDMIDVAVSALANLGGEAHDG